MEDVRTLNVEDGGIAVHAVGPGYGESVVLTIGKRFVLGIDCCTALVQPDSRGVSFLEQILSRGAEKPYVIWILSHFHFDHFQSFSALLDKLESRLQRLVVPGDYLSADLADLANHAKEDVGEAAFHLSKDEYSRLRRRLESLPKGMVSTLSGKGSLPDLALNIQPEGRKVVVRSEIFGPAYGDASSLKGSALNEMAVGEKNRSKGNHTSYIVRVQAGQFDSLFLGDCPSDHATQWSLTCNEPTDLFLLKVAHHGAEDGTSDDLLKAMGQKSRRRVALICPFVRHDLPKNSILDMLRRYGFRATVSGAKHDSASLRSSILSRTDPATFGDDLRAYTHGSNVRTVRGQLW